MLIRAHRLLLEAGVFLEDAGFRVERGKITEIVPRPRSSSEACLEFEHGLIAPGFVNAHAHLELERLEGVAQGTSMVSWIASIVAARRERVHEDDLRAWRSGSVRLLATGTTTVGDIDSGGACENEGPESSLGVVCYREVLDAGDPARAPSAMGRVQRPLSLHPRFVEGLSPHAPYTTSAALLEGCSELVRRRPMPLSIHWAETEEEHAWVESGEGAFAGFLGARLEASGGSLRFLDELGLVSGSTSLIHANHPRPGDLEVIAGRGAHVVHCPGTHRYYAREPFPVDDYREARISLALGTDSLASNEELDMGREMGLVLKAHPHLPASEVLSWATTGAARALGLGGRRGRLSPGHDADFVHHDHAPDDADEAAAMLAGPGRVLGTWVSGNEVWSKQNP